MKSQVTTKRGDGGTTAALGGDVYDKCHSLMEAVGALDSLRAQTALLRLQLQDNTPEALAEIGFLHFLLHTYFIMGTAISDPFNRKPEWHHGEMTGRYLERLEAEQQHLESGLTLPRAFIVSATNTLAAQADITAAAARTFERRLVAFSRETPGFDNPICLAFANRLSDYFFILARHFEKGRHLPVNYELLDGE